MSTEPHLPPGQQPGLAPEALGRRGGAGRRGGRRGGGRGEETRVPDADFRSYYGRPIIKHAVWKWDIAAYLFTGGLAAGSSLLAAGADATDRPALRRSTRITSLVSIAASAYFLVHDLGRPERFHHMLRVVKPTSPMSVGTWILTAFGPAAGVAGVSEAAGLLPAPLGPLLRVAGRVGGVGAAATAPALATYTAVLVADTAVPAWKEAHQVLPVVFAGSALAAAGGAALVTTPLAQTGPARRMAVAGAAAELAGSHVVETRLGLASEAYHEGRPAQLMGAARWLTSAGALGAVVGRRSRWASALSGLALLGGSLATRFGVFEAGRLSADDPRYTVVPQRERLDEGAPRET